MTAKLNEQQLEQLSAWMDGELEPAEAQRVQRLVADEPAWAEEHARLLALDRRLDAWAAPAPRDALAGQIVAAAHRSRRRLVLVRWLTPAAAAAAIVLAVVLLHAGPTNQPSQPAAQATPSIADFAKAAPALPTGDHRPIRTIADRLNGGRSWEELSAGEQDARCSDARAFLQKDLTDQELILQRAEQAAGSDPDLQKAWQQTRWVKSVLESFTPEERRQLQKDAPADRLAKYLARRDQLRREGKLTE